MDWLLVPRPFPHSLDLQQGSWLGVHEGLISFCAGKSQLRTSVGHFETSSCQLRISGSQLVTSSDKLVTSSCQLGNSKRQIETTGCQLGTSSCQLWTWGCLLGIAGRQQCTSECKLETSGCNLRTSCIQLPISTTISRDSWMELEFRRLHKMKCRNSERRNLRLLSISITSVLPTFELWKWSQNSFCFFPSSSSLQLLQPIA